MTNWRVLTWNILGAHDPDLGAIAAHIQGRQPDVVALQEVRRSQARRLAARLGWRWVWGRKHYPYGPLLWWRAEGLAILSPTPPADRRQHTISVGEPIWIYRHRVMLSATVTRAGISLRVHNTHLASDNADHRIDQARRAAGFIAADRSAHRVLCGDLNAPGEVEVLREFHAVGLRDPGGTVTNPSEAPMQRLDYVLLPEDATFVASDVPDGGEEWRRLSDHLPVLVEFTPA